MKLALYIYGLTVAWRLGREHGRDEVIRAVIRGFDDAARMAGVVSGSPGDSQ